MFKGNTPSIVDVLMGARAEVPFITPEQELPMLFGAPKSSSPLIVDKIDDSKPGRQVRLVSFTKVWVIWKPWPKCKRCLDAMDRGELELPDVGDWCCPHVQLDEYKRAKDKTLRGDAVKESEEHFQLHDGTCCVRFSWLETDPAFLEEMRKKEASKEDAVYPPNPDKIFSAPLPDQKEAQK